MVRIGHVAGLSDRVGHAGHFRGLAPVHLRQRPVVAERVSGHVVGPGQRPDAADELSPADDLTDEAFGRVDRNPACLPFGLNRKANLHRVKKAEVDVGRDQRVRQGRVIRQHRVLFVAKARQGVGDEMGQRVQGSGPVHCPVEGAQRAEVPEAGRHKVEHLFGHRIGGKARRAGAEQISLGRFAVVVVKVPLAARRFVAVHHQAGLAAHLAVEVLHPQGLAVGGPGGERGMRAQEAVVRQDAAGQRQSLQIGQHAPFAGMGGDQIGRPMLRRAAQDFAGQRLAVGGIVERRIGDGPAVGAKLCRKMSHGRQDQRDLLRVVRNRGALAHHLGHHHHIARLVRRLQGRNQGRQLIAQHQNQPYHEMRFPAQSKKPPVSAGARLSSTVSRLSAAVAGVTVGWPAPCTAVRPVCTVPGCKATTTA